MPAVVGLRLRRRADGFEPTSQVFAFRTQGTTSENLDHMRTEARQ